jgi:hypothetical protein
MSKIYKQVKFVTFLVCGGLFWQGCNIINPAEPVPTYIHIDSFKFVVNPLQPSLTLSHSIPCASVFYNDNPVGIFDLPVTFPIIASGTGTLEVYPVIAVDGQNNILGIYPYYEPDTSFSFIAQPGKILTHECTTTYFTADVVNKLSYFNLGLTEFYLDAGNIPMTMVTPATPGGDDSLLYPGCTGAGNIYLTNVGVDSSIDSTISFPIPAGVSFIEFDYKNDLPFYVGLQSNSSGISLAPYYLAGIYPSATWQKFYLKCSDYTAEYTGTSYNLYIKVTLPVGTAPGRVLLDNIQLITLPD